MREKPMHWRIIHYPAGAALSRQFTVRANSRAAARRKLAAAIRVPLWTLR